MKRQTVILTWFAGGTLLLLPACAGPGSTGWQPHPHSMGASSQAGPLVSGDFPAPPPEEEESAWQRRADAYAHYLTALSLQTQGLKDEALEHYLASAESDLGNAGLVAQVTRELVRRREWDRSLKLLKAACDQPGAPSELWILLAFNQAQLGKMKEAAQANQKAIDLEPGRFQPYQNLAMLHLQEGKVKEAWKILQECEVKLDDNVLNWLGLGEAYLTYGRQHAEDQEPARQAAEKAFDRARKNEERDPAILRRLADGYRQVGATEKALDLYAGLLQRYPRLPGLRRILAELYLRAGRQAEAREQLEQIVKDSPTDAQVYILLGTLAAEAREFKEAAGYLSKALIFRPELEAIYYDLARFHIFSDNPAEALRVLGEAREKFKGNFILEFFTGLAHNQAEKYGEAIKYFTAAEVLATSDEPERLNHGFYFQLGATHERNQDFAMAEKAFRKCLALEPNFHEAQNYLGYMWAERGEKLDEALDLIQKAVQAEPENAAYLDSLGWVFYQLKRPKEALPHIEKAVRLTEEPDPVLLDHLADVHAALGNMAQAVEAWNKALKLKPDPKIQKKLENATAAP